MFPIIDRNLFYIYGQEYIFHHGHRIVPLSLISCNSEKVSFFIGNVVGLAVLVVLSIELVDGQRQRMEGFELDLMATGVLCNLSFCNL